MGRIAAIAGLLALLAGPAGAEEGADPLSALYLQTACEYTLQPSHELTSAIQSGFCLGTILAAVHMHNYLAIELKQSPPLFCAPTDAITAQQWVRIFLAYAQKNPAQLHLNRIIVLSRAFAEAYPCAK